MVELKTEDTNWKRFCKSRGEEDTFYTSSGFLSSLQKSLVFENSHKRFTEYSTMAFEYDPG